MVVMAMVSVELHKKNIPEIRQMSKISRYSAKSLTVLRKKQKLCELLLLMSI
jgi:hypothetical protein